LAAAAGAVFFAAAVLLAAFSASFLGPMVFSCACAVCCGVCVLWLHVRYAASAETYRKKYIYSKPNRGFAEQQPTPTSLLLNAAGRFAHLPE
jgi:hypothetical protein